FIEQDGSGNNIYIVPSGGGEPYALTNGLDAAAPTWAPDGSGLAFIELADSAFRVSFLPLKREADGRITAGEPEVLFTADGIDVPSGLSWHAGR
ncbi:MAG: acylaminoacyl-peptidase, partial [Thermomicrobiales bacterium]|nr:acylaminoacyl-peptidase [Thermomicrobiales bacterium]